MQRGGRQQGNQCEQDRPESATHGAESGGRSFHECLMNENDIQSGGRRASDGVPGSVATHSLEWGYGNAEAEDGVAGAGGDEVEVAVVQLGDAAGNGEAEAGAAGGGVLGAGACGVGAKEAIEDAVVKVGGDAGAVVGDGDVVPGAVAVHVDDDAAAGVRVFDGVVDEVEHDAAEQVGIAVEWRIDESTQLDVDIAPV